MGLWNTLRLDMERHRLIALVGGGGKTTSLYALAHEARQAGKTVIVTTSTHIVPHPGLFLTGASGRPVLRDLLAQYGIVTVGTLTREDKMTGAEDLSACEAEADVVLVEADGARLRPLKAPADHEPVIPPEADAVIALCGMDCLGQSIQAASHRPERVAALLDKPLDAVVTPADAARVLLSPRGGRKNVGEKPFRCILNKADTPKRRTGAEEMASILAAQGVITAITFYTEEEQGGLCWF
jgi:probable selenium-dependent hydroxylase accessory protein YqeC